MTKNGFPHLLLSRWDNHLTVINNKRVKMFYSYLTYRFVLSTGREILGRVVAWDSQKILVETTDILPPANRILLYRRALALAEPTVRAEAV